MAQQGLDVSPPPRKPKTESGPGPKTKAEEGANISPEQNSINFDRLTEGEKVQFNKRVTRSTADGFQMLSIVTRKKIPVLLAEGLELLESKYGKV